ncbi:MAG: hypothetical protein SFY81_03420 [Verrucomicrobiota bacterium]|nr:hypothetical protein [Verrucomicrobiota bacterium]
MNNNHLTRWISGPKIVALLLLLISVQSAFSQGCVIARGGACPLGIHGSEGLLHEGDWQGTVAYRWLRSDRHFVGRNEQKHRKFDGTEVINDTHFIDLTATYAATDQLWVSLTIPFVHSDRSSLYEHGRIQRGHTQAGGLADVRLVGSYWIFNPTEAKKGNISFGLGVKAPTGDYKATDTFGTSSNTTVIRYVDSSIQPGDGGWGIILETQGYLHIAGNLSGYMNASYLINPRERIEETRFSVPDSYLARIGFDYLILPKYGISFTLGGRIEGVPPEDLIGGSLGTRRPGYAISIEPGFTYTHKRFFATLTTPVAVERNRQRTYNAATTGDAAFADFTVNGSISYRF